MLLSLRSDDERFKSITFRHGLNILVADRASESTSTDSRNGAGKSSLIEVLHFLLGLRTLTDSVLKNSALSDHSFTLEMDWRRTASEISITRSLRKRPKVLLAPNVVDATQAVAVADQVTNVEWAKAIGHDLFDLPEDHTGVSARGLLALYIRRVSQHGMDDAVTTFAKQSAAEASTNAAYLLGLDWRLAADYQKIAARESLRQKLRQAAKDPVFGLVIGSASELRGQITAASRRARELADQVAAFTVLPEHELLQMQADEIDAEIRGLRVQDAADRRNLQDLESAILAEAEPGMDYVGRVYSELGVSIPNGVVRTYEEVRRFHDSVMVNRRTYLQEEIDSTRERLDERQAQRERFGHDHARLLRMLNEGGALEAYTALHDQLSHARASLELLESRHETARKLEATQADIKFERSKLQQQISRDLDERESIVDEVNSLFQRFAVALYGPEREAYVEIVALDKSLKIAPHIGGEDSQGIGKMVVFCFDLTWAVLAHRAGRGPDFLVHDSHLFDGVDERQVAKALNLATQVCEEEGIQYVVTMNSDELDKVERRGVSLAQYVIEPRLTDDYEDGGLFGFRFE
ncbi:ABC-three component system protein [Salinibacterium sp. ZJ450]|uniref:ABC-three component system protein n=1 Tax=Salinibacterium sp. ZJ450 TaxID=2708338 RepID=UPI00141F1F7F|nr:ABC-three component system protein [Salinibacterium sp. ZJ450]